jgi:peptidylprolyl isomerase/peptidyl-prolyl cis-trans isomerase C
LNLLDPRQEDFMAMTVQASTVFDSTVIDNATSFDEDSLLCDDKALCLVTPSLARALAEIRSRYASESEFPADSVNCRQIPDGLLVCVESDPKFDDALGWIDRQMIDVSEADIEIFYLMHRDEFLRPEVRSLRHILVMIEASRENEGRAVARRRIDNARARLLKSPQRFTELAMKYSDCTSAVNGGLLGDVQRGQLHPALEKVAFSLNAGELSKVVESPRGFHLIHCLSIESASERPFSSVREKIRSYLIKSRRCAARKEWIASLFRQAA